MNTLFPVFLKIENLQTLLVGGGNVGLEKLSALLRNAPEAPITVVAPLIKEEILTLSAPKKNLKLKKRKFELRDLEEKDLVILATDDQKLHVFIQKEARKRRILVNVADTPDLCDFYLSSIVQKGDLKIAISTNGKSPTLAKRLKEAFQEALPHELDDILKKLHEFRQTLTGSFAEKVKLLDTITETLKSQK